MSHNETYTRAQQRQGVANKVVPMRNPPQIVQLLHRAQAGDHGAFEELYNLNRRRVYNLCLRTVRNTEVAEDLTQEAFLQLFRKIGTFRGESAFTTWLHRLTINTVLMFLRKKTPCVTSLDGLAEPKPNGDPGIELGGDDLRLMNASDRLALDGVIAALPPGYRLIFVLHDIEGYEHNEIAEFLGCTIGNSKSQLHKARLRIRRLLIDQIRRPRGLAA